MEKLFKIDVLSAIIAFCMSTYWLICPDIVYGDPYILGVFRGVIYTILIQNHIKFWILLLNLKN